VDNKTARKAMNKPVMAADFVIDAMIVDEDGVVIDKLPEFASSITRWRFAEQTSPFEEDDTSGEDFSFDEDDDTLGPNEDSDGSELVPPEESTLEAPDEDIAEERVLILEHEVTAAAFKELFKKVYEDRESTNMLAVVITYFVMEDSQHLDVFSHVFVGTSFTPDEVSGSRGARGRLLVRTCIDPFKVQTFNSGAADKAIKDLMREDTASTEVH